MFLGWNAQLTKNFSHFKLIIDFTQFVESSQQVIYFFMTQTSSFYNLFGRYNGKNRHIYQWNIIKNPEIDSHKYVDLVLDKGVKTFQ